MERNGVLHPVCVSERSGTMDTCEALLCMSYTLKNASWSGQEARDVQTDFSAAFDSINLQGILNKLCSVSIGGSLL